MVKQRFDKDECREFELRMRAIRNKITNLQVELGNAYAQTDSRAQKGIRTLEKAKTELMRASNDIENQCYQDNGDTHNGNYESDKYGRNPYVLDWKPIRERK